MKRWLLQFALLGALGVAAGGCFWGGDDDSTPTPTATETPGVTATAGTPATSTPGPTPTVGPTGTPAPWPEPYLPTSRLAVYTRDSGSDLVDGRFYIIREVVVWDLDTGEEFAVWRYSGIEAWPRAAAIAGPYVFVAVDPIVEAPNSNRSVIIRTDLRGEGAVEFFATGDPDDDAGESGAILRIQDLHGSPDGRLLAVTIHHDHTELGGLAEGAAIFFDPHTGEEVARVLKVESFPEFFGWPWRFHWRDDSRGIVLQGATYTDGPGGRATIYTDGTAVDHGIRGGLASPDGSLLATGEGRAALCYGAGATEVRVTAIETGALIRLFRPHRDYGLHVWAWSPGGEEVLVRADTYELLDDPSDCYPERAGWYVVRVDTGAWRFVLDEAPALREWYGEARVEVACWVGDYRIGPSDRPGHYWCWEDALGATGQVTVEGVPVGEGIDIRFLGIYEP